MGSPTTDLPPGVQVTIKATQTGKIDTVYIRSESRQEEESIFDRVVQAVNEVKNGE